MQRIQHLDDNRLDQRHIEASRHPVVEQPEVTQAPISVVDVLFVESPAKALRGAALHLPLDVARMDSPAGILRDRAAQKLRLKARPLVKVEVLADPLGMRKDLRREGVPFLRHITGLFKQRQIHVGFDSRSGIGRRGYYRNAVRYP